MGALALSSRLECEIVGVLIIVAVLLMWLGFHDAKVADNARQAVTSQVQAVAAQAAASQAARDAQTTTEQAGSLHAAQEQVRATAAEVVDLRAAVAGAYRLRDDAIRRAAAASHPGASAGGQAGGDTGADLVSWGLYADALGARAEAESDAADLAAYAAGLRTSGGLCVADYASARQVKP